MHVGRSGVTGWQHARTMSAVRSVRVVEGGWGASGGVAGVSKMTSAEGACGGGCVSGGMTPTWMARRYA